MSEAAKNKLAAQIIKAEMMNDTETVIRLKAEYDTMTSGSSSTSKETQKNTDYCTPTPGHSRGKSDHNPHRESSNKCIRPQDNRVKKFIDSTSSLSQMFVQEKKLSASDEVRMFAKTAAKFSRDNMDTKYFSEEIDDSQVILNKSKRHKQGPSNDYTHDKPTPEFCDGCLTRQAKHLVIEDSDIVFMTLMDAKPFLSSMSNVIIRNNDHSCDSFVSSSAEHQRETSELVNSLREAWKQKGYRCIIMETYFKNRRCSSREFTSCGKHFQVHCLPIKEKHFERARMCFKQALQASEGEWSMNRKLIMTDGRLIQRRLPKNLSYFWVCFDELDNGFGHVIESEQEFSRYFGLEVLSGLLDKDFNPMKLNQRENYKEQFERCRDFKLMYSEFRKQKVR